MHSLLKLGLMLSVIGLTGSAVAQDSTFEDSACVWVNGTTLVCAYPNLVYDEGIKIIVNDEIINGRHLESAWWPAPLDWYEIQVRGRCVRNNNSNSVLTLASKWGLAPRLDCPDGTTLDSDPTTLGVRIRELP